MPEFRLFLAGAVAGKPARHSSVAMKGGRPMMNARTGRPMILVHEPTNPSGRRSTLWASRIRDKVEEHMHADWPIQKPQPVFVRLVLFKQKPASWLKHRNWFTVKPDRDNCEKLFNDAMKTVAFEDDTQVVGGDVVKVVAPFDGMMIEMQWGPEVEEAFEEYFRVLTSRAMILRGGSTLSDSPGVTLARIQTPMSVAQEDLFAERVGGAV